MRAVFFIIKCYQYINLNNVKQQNVLFVNYSLKIMLSIIVPTLNEKKNIKILSRKLCKIHIISEIIFVDDNSIDGTYEEIKKIKNKKVRGYLRNSKNKDLSKSVLMGIKKTKNQNILVMLIQMIPF